MSTCPFGYRLVGTTSGARRLVNWAAAFAGYAACDARAETNREAYLSAFSYSSDFRDRADHYGVVDTKGFTGPCWAPQLWFDIDREGELETALRDARRLAAALDERYRLHDDELLIFHSGSKGFHLGLPTAIWQPEPSGDFNRFARRFAENVAGIAAVEIDSGVYDKVRAFRAPNSRHPKTGMYKRRLSADELNGLSLDRILNLAQQPAPFDVPEPTRRSEQAVADWPAAAEQVEQEVAALTRRRVAKSGTPTLNRSTLAFICDGAGTGDRHRLLYSAAANLAEFGCPPALAHALLSDAALDSGLPPGDVRRQIDCGLLAGGGVKNE